MAEKIRLFQRLPRFLSIISIAFFLAATTFAFHSIQDPQCDDRQHGRENIGHHDQNHNDQTHTDNGNHGTDCHNDQTHTDNGNHGTDCHHDQPNDHGGTDCHHDQPQGHDCPVNDQPTHDPGQTHDCPTTDSHHIDGQNNCFDQINGGESLSSLVYGVPIIFGDIADGRFILALPPKIEKKCKIEDQSQKCLKEQEQFLIDECQQKSPCQNQGISFIPSDRFGKFLIQDYHDSMVFLGGAAFIGATQLIGPGLGVILVFQGEEHINMIVDGLDEGFNKEPIRIPKNSSEIDLWRVGDKVSYSLAFGVMGAAGIQILGSAVGVMPSIIGKWLITVEKISENQVKIKYEKGRNSGIRVGAGMLIANTGFTSLTDKMKDREYVIDLSTIEGQEQFEYLMKYRHLFKDRTKDWNKLCKLEPSLRAIKPMTEGKTKIKSNDHRYFWSRVPFIFKYRIGKRFDETKRDQKVFGESVSDNKFITSTSNSKVKYKEFKIIRKCCDKKNKNRMHRVIYENKNTDAKISIENGKRTIFAASIFSYANDGLKCSCFKKAIREMLDYIDLGPYLPLIDGYEDLKPKESFMGSVSLTIDHKNLIKLMKRSGNLLGYLDQDSIKALDIIEYGKITKKLMKLAHKLVKIKRLYFAFGEDKLIEKKLRKTIDMIRLDYHLIKAVNLVIPDGLNIEFKLQGTDFYPIEYKVNLN